MRPSDANIEYHKEIESSDLTRVSDMPVDERHSGKSRVDKGLVSSGLVIIDKDFRSQGIHIRRWSMLDVLPTAERWRVDGKHYNEVCPDVKAQEGSTKTFRKDETTF